MIMTNFIMNVAAIAISLPVALVIAPYLGVSGEVILFSSLITAGMPFLLLVGAAPNAIAYNSRQFTTGEFVKFGIPASILLMAVTWLAVTVDMAIDGHGHQGADDTLNVWRLSKEAGLTGSAKKRSISYWLRYA